MLTTEYTLQVTPGGVPQVIHVSQYDVGSRTLVFNLLESSGGTLVIPSGASAAVRGTKPDGNVFDYNASISDSQVTVTLEEQMTAIGGKVRCEIYIYTGNYGESGYTQLATASFILDVKRAAMDMDTVQSDSQLRQFAGDYDAIMEAAEVTMANRTAAEAAQTAAESAQTIASQKATAAATSESNAAQSATAAAGSASAAGTSANNASAAYNLTVIAKNAAETAANNASTSETNAGASATAAAESASGAARSATDAEASATRAETAVEGIEDAGDAQVSRVEAVGTSVSADVESTRASAVQSVEDKGEEVLDSIPADYTELSDEVTNLKSALLDRVAIYGASGWTGTNTTLTRMYDAVGMTAQVGTDDATQTVVNNFDDVPIWDWKKCVGYWTEGDGCAVFHPQSFYGDADYAEDGSMGDYVAVRIPAVYYRKEDNDNIRTVCGTKLPGFAPFSILESAPNSGVCREWTYVPAYALGVDTNGHGVSLPGLPNQQGNYAQLLTVARNYSDADAAQYAMLEPDEFYFFIETMFGIEFATHSAQTIMQGCAGLRHNNDDRVALRSDGKWLAGNYYASRVVGEYISIHPTTVDINTATYYPSHKITAIIRCDADGNESVSGTYQLITTEDLGLGREYTVGDEYRIAGRPYYTGSCEDVMTPSGSPVSNSDTYHPMRYRFIENVYGNQYKTVMNLFNKRVEENGENHLEWYRLKDPTALANINPVEATLADETLFEKLRYETPTANYINGYITGEEYDSRYPELLIPVVESGGSASKYNGDYAYLVNSYVVRSVRRCGSWHSGATAGLGLRIAYYAPSHGSASSGAALYFAQ